jgi:hypothetical protein
MNSKRPGRFVGFPVFVSFSALLLLSILSSTVLLLPIRSAFADSYSDGYSEGCYDAGRDLKGLNGHGFDDSISHGNSQFRGGYVNGYHACWNSGVGGGAGGNNYQPQPTPQLQPPPTPSYPNYNWRQLCSSLDPVLVSPCNQLVNPDNTLTVEGYRGYICLRNGILLAGGGVLLNYPLPVIIVTLQALSGLTGCDGIIDWRSIDDVTDLRNIIRIFSK